MMAPFKLWLHAAHRAEDEISPLRVAEVAKAATVADRIPLLQEAVKSFGSSHCFRSTNTMEVFLTVGGLYALDKRGDRCLWLPLASSTIVQCENTKFEGAAGLLAYASPVASECFSWGDMRLHHGLANPDDADHVWVLVVTSAADSSEASSPSTPAHTLQLAMETLAAQGAIRSDVLGLTSLNSQLGEGSYGCVHVLKREVHEQSSDADNIISSLHLCSSHPSLKSGGDAIVRKVAAKVFTREASDEEACVEAGFLHAAQGHPNVVRFFGLHCHSFGVDRPSLVLMMEAHDGGCLNDRITGHGPLAPLTAFKLVQGLLQALVHIHALGIVHRDVKPQNILCTAGDHAILIDFGIAAHITEESKLRIKRGTPGYFAPEYLRKSECGVKADVFSAGVVLYFALSGKQPFLRKDKNETLRANAKAKPSYDRECFQVGGTDLVRFMRHLLVPASRQRCSSSVAVRAVLRLIEAHGETTGRDEPSAGASQQASIEPSSVPVEADDNGNDASASKQCCFEAANTRVDDFSCAGSSFFSDGRPSFASQDILNSARGDSALVFQSTLEPTQEVPMRGESQVGLKALRNHLTLHAQQELVAPLLVPGELGDDDDRHAVESTHSGSRAFTKNHDRISAASAAFMSDDEQESVSKDVQNDAQTRGPKNLLRAYRMKFSVKRSISEDTSASVDSHVQPSFESVVSSSPFERSTNQSTRGSSLSGFIRRSSCKERKENENDELADETMVPPSETSSHQRASNGFTLGRSALRMVTNPFRRKMTEVKSMQRNSDCDDSSFDAYDGSFDSYQSRCSFEA
eukprot:TRINITY_DN5749_c0_g2_i1.p1 TRINITY_DN5749_c0_g2~~TRINITY_DN5749_c0_g2_i1.p1  ORF type:complete len:804 (+),score=84.65 TRINITY_DN5749_c0_g2_i1:52-2463(+)